MRIVAIYNSRKINILARCEVALIYKYKKKSHEIVTNLLMKLRCNCTTFRLLYQRKNFFKIKKERVR
nr:MAG TPA: hypothetical protein [Caudoviricetes sp.]